MKFIDEAKIFVKSGNGGNGGLSFRREANIPFGGPDGGNGGRGGHIIFEANNNLTTLIDFRFKKHYLAKNGESGKGNNKNGKNAEDIILKVPIGTQIITGNDLLLADLDQDKKSAIIAQGGKGGLGNAAYKSSTNRTPRQFQPGEIGEELDIILKLKIISDIGIIGFPNAGKSTLISKISRAKPKIADYPFTTLKPNLGVVSRDFDSMVIADIPGLISGASEGVGLGHKFLKHIERCKFLLHLIDINSEDIVREYKIIRTELENYSKILAQKAEIVALNKIDVVDNDAAMTQLKYFKEKTGTKPHLISAFAGTGLEPLKHELFALLEKEKPRS